MKILIIYKLWGYAGGREQYLVDVINELIDRGHACSLVYAQPTNKSIKNCNAECIKKYKISSLAQYETNKDKDHGAYLRSILEREDPDIIFLSDVKNFILLRILINYGKLVSMAHTGWLFCLRESKTLYFIKKSCTRKLGLGCLIHGCFIGKAKKQSRKIIRYNSLRKLLRLVRDYSEIDTHLVGSQYMKDLFLQHGFKNEQVKIINMFTEVPNIYDINKYKNSNKKEILFVGRIDRYKGVDYLIKALSRIKTSFNCNIIGDGSYLLYNQKLAKKLNLEGKIHFLGWLPKEEIKSYYNITNIVVVPSIWPEPFGLVGIEAMAYRKPVVAFDSGGISEWLKDGETGYLVSSKDVVSLANKIDYLLRNPKVAHEMGNAGRSLVEMRFNIKNHCDQLISIFNKKIQK